MARGPKGCADFGHLVRRRAFVLRRRRSDHSVCKTVWTAAGGESTMRPASPAGPAPAIHAEIGGGVRFGARGAATTNCHIGS